MGHLGKRNHVHVPTFCASLAAVAIALAAAPAQAAYNVLYSFGSTFLAPANPNGTVIKSGTLLYGMTRNGGSGNRGILFKFDTTTGITTTLHNFAATGATPNGAWPHGNLIQSGSNLYGLTSAGTSGNSGGTLFRYDTATSTFSVLHGFTGGATDGAQPYGTPILSGNILYGLTSAGGSSSAGALFSYNLSTSSYSVLHHFNGTATDGAKPMGSIAISGSKLYGMTEDGGAANQGALFQYDTATQNHSLLHSFTGGLSDGSSPQSSLLAAGTKLYGTTDGGGAHANGTLFEFDTQTSTYDLLYDFGAFAADAREPNDTLVLVNNRLYGTSLLGGTSFPYGGTVFEFDPAAQSNTILHSFGVPPDGESPGGGVFFSGSTFYGMTEYGGANGNGTIFSLDLPEPSAGMMLTAAATVRMLRRRRQSSS